MPPPKVGEGLALRIHQAEARGLLLGFGQFLHHHRPPRRPEGGKEGPQMRGLALIRQPLGQRQHAHDALVMLGAAGQLAGGLHEALGLVVEGKNVFVVQRPELTRIRDTDGDDVADEFVTLCDKWGVSGDYHEFAFGPARDKQGNFFVTLNVGFGGGHQSKSPWRGWCVKITPKGELIPFATGLRSPNGVNFNP